MRPQEWYTAFTAAWLISLAAAALAIEGRDAQIEALRDAPAQVDTVEVPISILDGGLQCTIQQQPLSEYPFDDNREET